MKCLSCNHEFEPVSTLTVAEIEKILDAWVETHDSWNEVGERPYSAPKDQVGEFIPMLGQVVQVDSGGGTDQGSYAYVVLKIGDKLYRKSGSYASHDGFYWDGDFREVVAKEKLITVYE